MARDIYTRTLYIEFERARSIDLGSMFGDGHTKRHTHTYTLFFLKHIFRLWEWCRITNHKKSKSNFLRIAILSSLLMSLESKKNMAVKVPFEYAIMASGIFTSNIKRYIFIIRILVMYAKRELSSTLLY